MTITGRVTWFQITTNDTTAARAFYEGLFGWQAQGDQVVYSTFPPAEGGIPGSLMPARGMPSDRDDNLFSIYRFGTPSTASV